MRFFGNKSKSGLVIYLLVFDNGIEIDGATARPIIDSHTNIKENDIMNGAHPYYNSNPVENEKLKPTSLSIRQFFCLHDCPEINTFLKSKTGKLWLIPKFLNAFFRSIAQVIFANNPWSGILVLTGLFLGGFWVGILTSWSVAVGLLTSWALRQDHDKIANGLTTFSAVLVGSVTSSLWTSFYNEPIIPKVIGLITLGSVISVFLGSGLNTILGKWNLPSFTLPFNVATILLFTGFRPLGPESGSRDFKKLVLKSNIYEELSIGRVLLGIVYSMGQVYAVKTILGSILMYAGLALYSPISCFMSIVGATIGTLLGLLFTPTPSYGNVYDGIWGYNSILGAISIGGYFIPINSLSFLLASMNVIGIGLIQRSMSLALAAINVPVLTFPFVLSTMLFLSVSSASDYLTRVTKFSYPEEHLKDFSETIKEKRVNGTFDPNLSLRKRFDHKKY